LYPTLATVGAAVHDVPVYVKSVTDVAGECRLPCRAPAYPESPRGENA
jgi:hypothetical protein